MTTTASPFVKALGTFNPSGNHAALMLKLASELQDELSKLHALASSGQAQLTDLTRSELLLIRDTHRQALELLREGEDQMRQTDRLMESLLRVV